LETSSKETADVFNTHNVIRISEFFLRCCISWSHQFQCQ